MSFESWINWHSLEARASSILYWLLWPNWTGGDANGHRPLHSVIIRYYIIIQLDDFSANYSSKLWDECAIRIMWTITGGATPSSTTVGHELWVRCDYNNGEESAGHLFGCCWLLDNVPTRNGYYETTTPPTTMTGRMRHIEAQTRGTHATHRTQNSPSALCDETCLTAKIILRFFCLLKTKQNYMQRELQERRVNTTPPHNDYY